MSTAKLADKHISKVSKQYSCSRERKSEKERRGQKGREEEGREEKRREEERRGEKRREEERRGE